MVTATVSELVAPLLSVTVRLNFNKVSFETIGASKLTAAVFGLFNTTAGPSVCVHKYEVIVPSESELLLPSSTTSIVPSSTILSDPAYATGGKLPAFVILKLSNTSLLPFL